MAAPVLEVFVPPIAAAAVAPDPGPSRAGAWTPELLQFVTELALTPDEGVRVRVAELVKQRHQMPESAVRGALHPLALATLRSSGEVLATALGVSLQELLEFSHPATTASELTGRRAIKRRLDRLWGGAPMTAIEALQSVLLPWPGPFTGRCILVRGEGHCNHDPIQLHASLTVRPGTILSLEPGALLLLRRPLIGSLLNDLHASGIGCTEAIREICSQPLAQITTRAGVLTFLPDHSQVRLQQRQVELTPSEWTILKTLAEHPRRMVGREALNQAAKLANLRSLDRMILGLRDKLGDGLIRMAYRQGYTLELPPEQSTD